jgi:hypothetical protein
VFSKGPLLLLLITLPAAAAAASHCLQNEIEYEDAVKLVNKGVTMVLEGANMPSTNDAISHFHKCGVVLAAAKACNAGANKWPACALHLWLLRLFSMLDLACMKRACLHMIHASEAHTQHKCRLVHLNHILYLLQHRCSLLCAVAAAGGVAVSGLEMAQNACMTTWTAEQVDERLKVRLQL